MNLAFVSALLISLASFGGLLFVTKKARSWMFRNMKYLISFAAGVFFMTALSLSQETFEMLDLRDGALAIIIGFVAIWLVHIFFPETHHHHDHECKHHNSRNAGIKVLVGDTIHNTGDGIMLVTAFSISTELGVFAALSIFVHEFFQEISEFFVLREAGYSIKQTLTVNALSALSIFIGIGIGIFLTQSVNLQGFLLGITAEYSSILLSTIFFLFTQ